jgi:hypothetical protein
MPPVRHRRTRPRHVKNRYKEAPFGAGTRAGQGRSIKRQPRLSSPRWLLTAAEPAAPDDEP